MSIDKKTYFEFEFNYILYKLEKLIENPDIKIHYILIDEKYFDDVFLEITHSDLWLCMIEILNNHHIKDDILVDYSFVLQNTDYYVVFCIEDKKANEYKHIKINKPDYNENNYLNY